MTVPLPDKPILIVDDDARILEILHLYLDKAGFRTVAAADGAAALEAVRQEQPCLIILDLMLPRMDGMSVTRRLRAESQVPIIMLTARVDPGDRIQGLESGADDYVTKPFHPQEMVARVKAVLRRAAAPGGDSGRPARLDHGPLSMDPARFTVHLHGRPVELTPIEFRLLKALVEEPDFVHTRDYLLDQVYSFGEKEVLYRTVDAHIRKIRQKLREADPDWDPIATVRGVGYKMAEVPA